MEAQEFRVLCELGCWDSLKHLKICEVKKKNEFPEGFIQKEKMRGNNPAQNSRRNVSHWIGASPLDVENITLLGAINGVSWATKRQYQF